MHKSYLDSLPEEDIDILNLWTKNNNLFHTGHDKFFKLQNIIHNAVDTTEEYIKVYRLDPHFDINNLECQTDRILSSTSSLEVIKYLLKYHIPHHPLPISPEHSTKSEWLDRILNKHPKTFRAVPNYLKIYSSWNEALSNDKQRSLYYLDKLFNEYQTYQERKIGEYTTDLRKWYDNKDNTLKYLLEIYVNKNFLDISSESIPLGLSQEEIIIAPSIFKVENIYPQKLEAYSNHLEDRNLLVPTKYQVNIETVVLFQH